MTAPQAPLIAVIDGTDQHRRQIALSLAPNYRVASFADMREAVASLQETPPLAILVDESARPFGGAECVRLLRDEPMLRDVRLIATSAVADSDFAAKAMLLGCAEVLRKPFRRTQLMGAIARSASHAQGIWHKLAPRHRRVLHSTLDAFNNVTDMIERGEPIAFAGVRDACSPLVDAVCRDDVREILHSVRGHDDYSYVHSLRVATYLSLFGHAIGLKGDDLLVLAAGGLLHDIGKVSVPLEVLNKPGRLDENEAVIMRGHVERTMRYIEACPDIPRGTALIAAQHHEMLDGSGYPNGLKRSQLNELARMAAIVDVFSALTDRRVYKQALAPETALKIMQESMRWQLDQHMLRLFIDLLLSGPGQSLPPNGPATRRDLDAQSANSSRAR
jgi:HD-GYP domain-containing protein (c-di-GMP phosphodiesterase class II)